MNKELKDNNTRRLLMALADGARESNAEMAKITLDLEGVNDYHFEIIAKRGKMK